MAVVVPLRELGIADLPRVGEKNALLGEIGAVALVPEGFAIEADAYRAHLRAGGLEDEIRRALRGAHGGDVHDLVDRSDHVRDLVLRARLPDAIAREIDLAYRRLSAAEGHLGGAVAVRPSATCRELSDTTYASQYESFLNVRGAAALEEAVRHVFASMFTPAAIADRLERGIEHLGVAMAVVVQAMVRSDLASAGTVYTADPATGNRSRIVVVSSWGLGENVLHERVAPDRIFLDRQAVEAGQNGAVIAVIGSKETKSVYDAHGHRQVVAIPVDPGDRQRLSCSRADAFELARKAVAVERHLARVFGDGMPIEIEWAKDGITGVCYVVQARGSTAHGRRMASGNGRADTLDAAS